MSPGVADRFVPSSGVDGDRVVHVRGPGAVTQPAFAQSAKVPDCGREPELHAAPAPPTTRRRSQQSPPPPPATPSPRRDRDAAAAVLVGRRVRPVVSVHRHGLDGRPEADHCQGAYVARGTAQPGQP